MWPSRAWWTACCGGTRRCRSPSGSVGQSWQIFVMAAVVCTGVVHECWRSTINRVGDATATCHARVRIRHGTFGCEDWAWGLVKNTHDRCPNHWSPFSPSDDGLPSLMLFPSHGSPSPACRPSPHDRSNGASSEPAVLPLRHFRSTHRFGSV